MGTRKSSADQVRDGAKCVTLQCAQCGHTFQRLAWWLNRAIKVGRTKHYCSGRCRVASISEPRPAPSIDGFCATIPLTRGQYAIVDAADLAAVLPHRWQAVQANDRWYATTHIGRRMVQMQRILCGAAHDGDIDHRNRDGLDNRRANLREATRAQNNANARIPSHNTSGFKGVSFDKARGKWVANIKSQGWTRHLGRYLTPEEAARAYDLAAFETFGEFARVNFARAA